MNDVVISARGLGKRYLIGHEKVDRNQTFRERIMAGAGALVRNLAKTARGEQLVQGEVEEFWALKDVDFDIRRGDTVGIIGRNGAGKSTLLKILSRITEPTTGRVDIRGRVASLLEVGTGFHPELTGRENIFLNGAILGMSRAEIRRKLDEIIDFAGVEKFLDTPVKRYSSGMRVRLAFSVAAFLEPEILIVDEVLAVGDVEFQRKCLGKMKAVAHTGRTVLFVSHNLTAVANICSRGIILHAGAVQYDGTPAEAISLHSEFDLLPNAYANRGTHTLDQGPIASVELSIYGAEAGQSPVSGGSATLDIHLQTRDSLDRIACSLWIATLDGQPLFRTSTQPIWDVPISIGAGQRATVSLFIERLALIPGQYVVGFGVTQPNIEFLFREEQFCRFDVRIGSDDESRPMRFPEGYPAWPKHYWSLGKTGQVPKVHSYALDGR